MTTIVAISDTHSMHRGLDPLPDGDVLIHSGDFSSRGMLHEFRDFVEWFADQPHEHKVFTCGNHDWICERDLEGCRDYVPAGIHFLVDEAVKIDGKVFYGSPWTPMFHNWAYMLDRGGPIAAIWANIPDDTDVLITHGPPYGHGDLVPGGKWGRKTKVAGCLELLTRVIEVKPAVHFFGHIHEGYGVSRSDENTPTIFVNAATCNGDYEPVNPPQVVIL